MFRYYFKIAWRNISRNKVYTAINVLGLALGVCTCMVIFLMVSYDFSFDRFHPDGDRIYRIVGDIQNGKGEKEYLNSVFEDVAGFQNAIPGFEAKVGFHGYAGDITVPARRGVPAAKFDGVIPGQDISASILTGPGYFSVFQYKWLTGNASVLNQPYRVVLTESAARKYFGKVPLNDMIGKTLMYDDTAMVLVGGIVKDWNQRTDIPYTHFISITTPLQSGWNTREPIDDWRTLRPHGSQAFVKLARGVTPEQVNAAFANYIQKNVKPGSAGSKLRMYLQPLSDTHFTDEFHRGDDGDGFRKAYKPTLYALMGLALFILVIAAVNFINLSTAQSLQRAKEIGVRKVMGGRRYGLILQFLTETLVLVGLAEVFSILLTGPVIKLFSSYIPEGVTFHLTDPVTLLFLLSILVVTTLLAGFYPARVLSSYVPVLSLKGANFQKGSGRLDLRKTLIVFQFTISLVFVFGALVIGEQIRFMRDADKGFNSDAVITMSNYKAKPGQLSVFVQNVKKISGVGDAILQGNSPMGFGHMTNTAVYKGKNFIDATDVSTDAAGGDFIPFYGIRLLAGRNILEGDSVKEIVINETYAHKLGFAHPTDALGKIIYTMDIPHPIVGVAADFMENSFHQAIGPVMIMNMPQWKYSVAIKLLVHEDDADDAGRIRAAVGEEWKKTFPDQPPTGHFLNEEISWLYDQEKKTAWLVNLAMGVTIFISCMGLFGLGMYTAQRRTKEIGIRKTLGAGVTRITLMLTKDFLMPVAIAFVIAAPIAWYGMHRWLMDFAYRTSIGWQIFALSALAAMGITLGTVGYQAIKAALANPARSLRTE